MANAGVRNRTVGGYRFCRKTVGFSVKISGAKIVLNSNNLDALGFFRHILRPCGFLSILLAVILSDSSGKKCHSVILKAAKSGSFANFV